MPKKISIELTFENVQQSNGTPGRTMERDPWVGEGFESHVVTHAHIINTPIGTPMTHQSTVTASASSFGLSTASCSSRADGNPATVTAKPCGLAGVPSGPPPSFIPTPSG